MGIVTACLVVEQSLRKVLRGALVHLFQHLLPFLSLSSSSTNKNDFYASPPLSPPPHTYPDHHHHHHHTQDAALRLPHRQNRVVGGGERSHSRRLPEYHRGRRNLFLCSSFTTSGTDPHIVLRHRLGDCHHPLWLQVGGLHERLDPKNPQKTGESRRQARDYGR